MQQGMRRWGGRREGPVATRVFVFRVIRARFPKVYTSVHLHWHHRCEALKGPEPKEEWYEHDG